MSADLGEQAEVTGEPAEVFERPAGAPEAMSATEAGRLLASLRQKKLEPAAVEPAKAVEPVAETQESEAKAEDAAPPDVEVPGETQEVEAEELPPIDPPRSWKAEEKARFRALPRETQEYLAEREQERDRDLNQRQSEAAEKLKGLTAKEQAAEQARQQYESALPQVLQALQTAQVGEFGDVKSMADVERLAREDWPRYLQWDVAQKKIAAVQQEMQAAQTRQHQEKADKFKEFATKEDDAFAKNVPESKDAKTFEKLQQGALTLLKDLGFSDSELGEGWNGSRDFSLRDHRLQLLIRDASLYRQAQQRAKEVAKKPVPKAQRPGIAQPAGAVQANQIKDLEQRLAESTGVAQLRIATELMAARRQLGR
jgi:hypothetical protein